MAVEGLSIRLYLDHNVDPLIAIDLRRRGFNVSYASEEGLERASDNEHLEWATTEKRTILTHDQGDFRLLATE